MGSTPLFGTKQFWIIMNLLTKIRVSVTRISWKLFYQKTFTWHGTKEGTDAQTRKHIAINRLFSSYIPLFKGTCFHLVAYRKIKCNIIHNNLLTKEKRKSLKFTIHCNSLYHYRLGCTKDLSWKEVLLKDWRCYVWC